MRIGVDTGGTFTDCVMFAGSEIRILKVFSTPADSSRAILEGVCRLAEREAAERLDIIHGTTVGTNSVLERRGARVALVTTAGFEDLIEIGRQPLRSQRATGAAACTPLHAVGSPGANGCGWSCSFAAKDRRTSPSLRRNQTLTCRIDRYLFSLLLCESR